MLFNHLKLVVRTGFSLMTLKGTSEKSWSKQYRRKRKSNGFNVFIYLAYWFLYMPKTDWCNHPEELDALMSWLEIVQEEYKA